MPNPIEILAKGGKSLLKKAAEGKAAVEDLAKDGVKAGKGALRSSRSAAKNLLEDSHSLSFRQNVPHAEVKVPKAKAVSSGAGKHIEKPIPTEHSGGVKPTKAQSVEPKAPKKGVTSTTHKTEPLAHEGHKGKSATPSKRSGVAHQKANPEVAPTHEKTSGNRVASSKKASHIESSSSKEIPTKEKSVSKASGKKESVSAHKAEELNVSSMEISPKGKQVKSAPGHSEKEAASKISKESKASKEPTNSSEIKKEKVSSPLANAKENDSLVNEASIARRNAAKAEQMFDKHGTHESMVAWREAMEKSAALDEKVMALGDSAAKASGIKTGSAVKSEIDNAIDSAIEARVRVKELKEEVKENPALQKELFSALDAEKSATERALQYGNFTEKEITKGFKARFADVEKTVDDTVVKGQPMGTPNRGIPQGKYSGLSEENQMKILGEENAIERSKVSVQEKKVDVDASIKQEDSALKKYKAENEAELAKEKLAIEKEKINAETAAKQEEHSLNRFKAESEVELNREKNIIEKEKVFSESRRGDRELGLKERELDLKEKEINIEKSKPRHEIIKDFVRPLAYLAAGYAGVKLVAYDGGLVKQVDDTLNGVKESKRDKDGKLIEPETNLLGHTSETVLGKETTQRIGSAVDGLEGAASTVLRDGQKVFNFTFDTANGVKDKVSDVVDYTGKKATDYLDSPGDSKYYSRAIDPATGQPIPAPSSPRSTVEETIDNLRNGKINSTEMGKVGLGALALKTFGKSAFGTAMKIAGIGLSFDGLRDMNVRNRNQGVSPVVGPYNPYYDNNLIESVKPVSQDDSYHMKR